MSKVVLRNELMRSTGQLYRTEKEGLRQLEETFEGNQLSLFLSDKEGYLLLLQHRLSTDSPEKLYKPTSQ